MLVGADVDKLEVLGEAVLDTSVENELVYPVVLVEYSSVLVELTLTVETSVLVVLVPAVLVECISALLELGVVLVE